MASVSQIMENVSEVLSPLTSELLMFALAALVYILASRSLTVPVKKKSGSEKDEKKAAVARPRHPWKKEMEETAEVYHEILQLAKGGEAFRALSAMKRLDSATKMALPTQVATKVLLALAKSPQCESLTQDFLDLSVLGWAAAEDQRPYFRRAFEAASTEASRWRNVAACLASVHKSEKFLVLLVRGHSNDHRAMHSIVEDILAEGVSNLSRSFLDSLVTQCFGAKNQDTAKIIQEHENSMGMDTNRQARIISSFGKEGNLEAAVSAFQKWKDSGAAPTVIVYNCMLDACIECKALPRALKIFEEMKEKSLADVVSYNTIMKGHLMTHDTGSAEQVFMQMHQAGLTASRVTYHALLNALVNRGDRTGAWRIESDIQMDEVLFGGFADACIRCGNLKLLWKQYQQLFKTGHPVQVSGPTYGNMIKAFGQVQDIQCVQQLWKHMCSQHVKLTAVTLGCMVEALVSNNCVSEAWKIVNDAWSNEEQRELLNTVVYSTIVKGFTMSRQHDQVIAVFKEMKDGPSERGIACNTVTYNTMLNGLARCGMMHEVPELLKGMRDSDPPVQPDIITYSTIVKGYCIAGDVDRAFGLLDEMKKLGNVKPDEVLYNSLLDGCAKQSRVEEALKLLEEMKQQGVVPSNYTLSILCKLLGRGRRLEQAFQIVKTFTEEYGFKANIQVYTCLMQACIHNRQCQRALSLHDQVVKDGVCVPDAKTYTVLLRGCLQAGLVDKALAVTRCAYHLPGHDLRETDGWYQGVEPSGLEDLLASLASEQREALVKDAAQGATCKSKAFLALPSRWTRAQDAAMWHPVITERRRTSLEKRCEVHTGWSKIGECAINLWQHLAT
eukprot:s606_g19.t1